MLTDEDKLWLREKHPGLAPVSEGVTGTIEFEAAYNKQSDRFFVPCDGVANSGSVVLSGQFKIRIQERINKSFSSLPAVFVEEVDPISDRHFSQIDKTACLCSPLIENEFLVPKFQFEIFLERLVIPFLYAQVYYSREKHWPWSEYAHGATGLLEAYSKIADPSKADECLQKLALDANAWPRIKAALHQEPYVKGHTPCFCPKRNPIRRCHPRALEGIQQLRRDIRTRTTPNR
jgi:hypothetical protein